MGRTLNNYKIPPPENKDVNTLQNQYQKFDSTLSNHNLCSLKHIQIGSLNVCGLRRRLRYPEFQSLISKYDVFCVQETKLDNIDVISLNNYTFLSQIRKQKFIERNFLRLKSHQCAFHAVELSW